MSLFGRRKAESPDNLAEGAGSSHSEPLYRHALAAVVRHPDGGEVVYNAERRVETALGDVSDFARRCVRFATLDSHAEKIASKTSLPAEHTFAIPTGTTLDLRIAVKADESSEELAATIARMAKIGSCYSPTFSPDGKQIAFVSDMTGVPQVWTVGVEGGWPRQVTALDDQVGGVSWSPVGNWLAFSMALGGGMNQQVYVIRADGQKMKRLTDGGKDNNWLASGAVTAGCSRWPPTVTTHAPWIPSCTTARTTSSGCSRETRGSAT